MQEEIQTRINAAIAEFQAVIRDLSIRAANLAADLAVAEFQKVVLEGEIRSVRQELEELKTAKQKP
jgi:cell division protein FtsB